MKTITTISAALCLLASASMASANLLVNGDFENQPNWGNGISGDAGYTAMTGSQIPGWTVAAGHAATIHNTVMYPTITGQYSLNTDGEGYQGRNVDIFQDFASTSNQMYQLTFDWKNWFSDQNVRLNVLVEDPSSNSVLIQGTYGLLAGLHTEVLSFAGNGGNLRVRIRHSPESGYNDNTFIVDNFSVQPVPEPASVLALSAGLLAIRRRKRS